MSSTIFFKVLIACTLFFTTTDDISKIKTEKDKINYLLNKVENLDQAKFWRNGSYYKASKAVSHMKLKWRRQSGDIKTAEDFIRLAATKSSFSNRYYRIKFKDGTEKRNCDYLREELKKLNQRIKDLNK